MRSLFLLLAFAARSGALLLDVRAGGTRCLHEILSKHDLVKAAYKLEPRAGAPEGARVSFEARVRARGARARDRPQPPRTHTRTPPHPCIACAQVTGPDGKTEFREADQVTGKFSFTADDGGSHSVCLTNLSPHQRRVELTWAAGVGTIDYADMAKKEQLKPLEVREEPASHARKRRGKLTATLPPLSHHRHRHRQLELRKLEDRLSAVQREMQYQREREESHRDLSETTNSRVVWFSWLTITIVVVQAALQVMYLYNFFSKRKYLN